MRKKFGLFFSPALVLIFGLCVIFLSLHFRHAHAQVQGVANLTGLGGGSYHGRVSTNQAGTGPWTFDTTYQNALSAAPSSPLDRATYTADRVNWNPASLSTATETASTIAFVSGSPATITDSGNGFVTAGFLPGQFLKVTSGANAGTYQLANVAAGTLTLVSGQTLTSVSAGTSFTLVGGAPYKVLYSANGNAGSPIYYPTEGALGNSAPSKLSTTAPLAASLLSNGAMTANITGWSGTNWAYNAANGGEALHTAGTGNTTALSSANALVSGQSYLITYTVQFGTAGTVTMSAGGMTDSARSASGTYTYYGTASATTAIAFTPTATFDGAVQLVSVQAQGPKLTSCGTGPSLQEGGSGVAGNVTMGSGSPTACTVTFPSGLYANTPACIATPVTASAAAVIATISASNTAFTVSFSATATAPATSPAAATGFSYVCVGQNE